MHLLSEPLNRDGEFWLPETPDHPSFGHLIFDPAVGITIKLLGSLRPFPDSFNETDVPGGVIHGRLEDGKAVSLFGCFRTSHQLTFGNGFPRETYRANLAAIGVQTGDLKAKTFRSATIGMAGLEAWLEKDWYPRTVVDADTKTVSVHGHSPKKDAIFKGRRHSVFVNRFSNIEDQRRHVRISAEADLKIQRSDDQSIDWYMQQSALLGSFLSFCLAQPTKTEFFTLRVVDDNDATRFADVELVYARIDQEKVDTDKAPLAPFSSLPKDATKRWMHLYSKAKSAVRLVQEVQSAQVKYVNLRFLLAAQAAE
ncbi:MAG: hypothetical protein H0U23_15235, partial [Blastocatellia bacterium]|nr:hypothetical protein [Blastocatellia bacterium]